MPGRKKKSYAFKHRLNVEAVDPALGVQQAWYWVVTNLVEDMYMCERLRNALGIWEEEAVRQNANSPEIVTVNSTQELCRMGVCGEISCTIVSVDRATYYPAIGYEQKTSFVFDLTKSAKDVARDLLAVQILVGPTRVPYKIVPGTVRIKSSRSRTPHLG